MILLSFRTNDSTRLGIKTDVGVIDVTAAGAALTPGIPVPATIAEAVGGGPEARAALNALVAAASGAPPSAPWLLSEAGLTFGPAVPNPGKIICVGLNYRRHAAETNMPVPQVPVLFGKFGNSVAAHGETIPLPLDGEQFDYEAELAIVMGRRARSVEPDAALEYVYGYCNANDFSCRDVQMRNSQWIAGKSYDGWCPLGPYLVTADAVPNPDRLGISCQVNGELRQNSNTEDMIFSCREMIAYISRYITLEPGDVILTGTPEGVAMGMASKPWLKPGDKIVIAVEGLGALTNVVGKRG